jgi:ABC-type proline/glycine betaine transport system permease subunit
VAMILLGMLVGAVLAVICDELLRGFDRFKF